MVRTSNGSAAVNLFVGLPLCDPVGLSHRVVSFELATQFDGGPTERNPLFSDGFEP